MAKYPENEKNDGVRTKMFRQHFFFLIFNIFQAAQEQTGPDEIFPFAPGTMFMAKTTDDLVSENLQFLRILKFSEIDS